ncbi:MAG: hypothetical protein ABIJ05_00105 [Patescibacteria group bacterium]
MWAWMTQDNIFGGKMKKVFMFVAIVSLLTSCSFFKKQESVEPTRNSLIIAVATQIAKLENPTTDVEEKLDEAVTSVANQTDECPQAMDLGPWAPNSDGSGENFEVTCNETVCVATHVQLWWPGGSGQEWGTKEISVLLPSGLSIEVQSGSGRGWEYPVGCSLNEIKEQISADNSRRQTDTSFFGQVDINELIDTGLVIIRFDRRPNPTQ